MTAEKAKKVVKPTVKKSPKVISKPEIVTPQIPTPLKVEIQETESVGFWQWLLRLFK